MRAMFGLVALLVTFAIIAILWSMSVPTTVNKGKEAEKQVKPFTERTGIMDDTRSVPGIPGSPAPGGITLSADPRGLIVSDIGPQNPLWVHYGLRKGDRILVAGDVDLKGMSDGDAKMFLQTAGYEKQRELIVDRNGERLRLEFKQ